jgi:hypothetical protein
MVICFNYEYSLKQINNLFCEWKELVATERPSKKNLIKNE